MAKPSIFIDGEHGTTGLLIRELLRERSDVAVLSIAADKRKDAAERKRLLNAVDLAILCLPDDAARESVAMIDNPAPLSRHRAPWRTEEREPQGH